MPSGMGRSRSLPGLGGLGSPNGHGREEGPGAEAVFAHGGGQGLTIRNSGSAARLLDLRVAGVVSNVLFSAGSVSCIFGDGFGKAYTLYPAVDDRTVFCPLWPSLRLS